MSINLLSERLPWESDEPLAQVFEATGFPPGHPAEPDLFVRQRQVPGLNQAALEQARVVMVGAGGLGSWTGLGLARSGVRNLTIIDPDRFDRTNAHRQLMFPEDLGRYKASSVARNLVPHMIGSGTIQAVCMPFEQVARDRAIEADLLLVLVDNNLCRLAACRWALSRPVPVVYAMLSVDGLRLHAFLQKPQAACLWCALPNLDPDANAPCAAATITSCLLVAGHVVFLAHRALMGWPKGMERFNWIDDYPESSGGSRGVVERRRGCVVCDSPHSSATALF